MAENYTAVLYLKSVRHKKVLLGERKRQTPRWPGWGYTSLPPNVNRQTPVKTVPSLFLRNADGKNLRNMQKVYLKKTLCLINNERIRLPNQTVSAIHVLSFAHIPTRNTPRRNPPLTRNHPRRIPALINC